MEDLKHMKFVLLSTFPILKQKYTTTKLNETETNQVFICLG